MGRPSRWEQARSEGFRGMAPWFGLGFLVIALVFVYRSFYKMRVDGKK